VRLQYLVQRCSHAPVARFWTTAHRAVATTKILFESRIQ
jgi:hypothetical protein